MNGHLVYPSDPPVSQTHEGTAFVERLRRSIATEGEEGGVLTVLAGAACHGVFLDRERGAFALARALGADDFARLRSALARIPCNCCHCGCESCPACDGTGATEDIRVCRPCAGFGKVRCDFCGGTGLAPYEVFPAGLCFEVARGRVALAISRSARLGPPARAGESSVRAVQNVLNLNKLLAVLENGRAEIQNWLANPSWARAAVSLIAATDSAAQTNFHSLYLWLQALVGSLELQPQNGATALTAGRAEFYRNLLETADLKGTLLDHPFLNAALTAPAPSAKVSALN